MMKASFPDLVGEHRAEAIPPEPQRLVTDVDAALEQNIFDLSQRQRIADKHHHRKADHLGRAVETTKGIAHRRRLRNLARWLKLIHSDNAASSPNVRCVRVAVGAFLFLVCILEVTKKGARAGQRCRSRHRPRLGRKALPNKRLARFSGSVSTSSSSRRDTFVSNLAILYCLLHRDPNAHVLGKRRAGFSRPIQRNLGVQSNTIVGGLNYHFMRV